jgi:hypothetical protein
MILDEEFLTYEHNTMSTLKITFLILVLLHFV